MKGGDNLERSKVGDQKLEQIALKISKGKLGAWSRGKTPGGKIVGEVKFGVENP